MPAKVPHSAPSLTLLESRGFADYRLLDSGNGRKLERFGQVVVNRPEPQALWQPLLAKEKWAEAHATFSGEDEEESGKWRMSRDVPESWPVQIDGITMRCRLSAFRHLGLFPEQLPHWQRMVASVKHCGVLDKTSKPRVLNLFAYTGAASLLAAHAGAEVTHLDASKKAVGWAKENQAASRLRDAPIRWILDDARKFAAREVRRGRTYHVVLVDPPKFGRGPEGEVWDLFEHLPALLDDCARLLFPGPAMLVLTAYAIRASALSIGQLTAEKLGNRSGRLSIGELAIREEAGARAIPTSLYTTWCSDDLPV